MLLPEDIYHDVNENVYGVVKKIKIIPTFNVVDLTLRIVASRKTLHTQQVNKFVGE